MTYAPTPPGCPQLNVKFIDTEFLPDSTSIYEPDSGFVDPNLPITWRSAKYVPMAASVSRCPWQSRFSPPRSVNPQGSL